MTTHYWTGRGTLCSLDNSVTRKPNHVSEKAKVDCQYCRYMIDLNASRQEPPPAQYGAHQHE